jgi:hypothetical protein
VKTCETLRLLVNAMYNGFLFEGITKSFLSNVVHQKILIIPFSFLSYTTGFQHRLKPKIRQFLRKGYINIFCCTTIDEKDFLIPSKRKPLYIALKLITLVFIHLPVVSQFHTFSLRILINYCIIKIWLLHTLQINFLTLNTSLFFFSTPQGHFSSFPSFTQFKNSYQKISSIPEFYTRRRCLIPCGVPDRSPADEKKPETP